MLGTVFILMALRPPLSFPMGAACLQDIDRGGTSMDGFQEPNKPVLNRVIHTICPPIKLRALDWGTGILRLFVRQRDLRDALTLRCECKNSVTFCVRVSWCTYPAAGVNLRIRESSGYSVFHESANCLKCENRFANK